MASPITKINPRGINTTGDYVVNSLSSTGNVTAGNIKTDNLLYANGSPYAFTTNAAGTNTQVQFNDGNSFAGSANLTFNKTTGTLTANFFVGDGSGLTGLPASYTNSDANSAIDARVTKSFIDNLGVNANTLNGHSDTYFATSTQGNLAETAVQPNANISVFTNDSGYLVAGNLSSYATKTDVGNSIANLVASAPAALDTLNELANALGNDANYSTTITNALANKLSTSSFNSTANTWLALQTTSNVTEGTNLYYTVTRANTAIDNRVTKSFVDNLGINASSLNGHSDTYFATSAQGTLADSAVQPGDNVSDLVNDAGYLVASNLSTYATKTDVGNSIANLVNSAPGVLDTLGEIANALGNDANYSTTITTALAGKLNTTDFNSTANSWLALQSTSNVTEGTNLYYTVTRANTAIDNRVTKSFVDNLGVTANIANIAYSVSGSNVSGAVQYAAIANSVSGSNVVGDVSGANHANVSDVANSVAVANVTGIGNIATINKDGNASNILYGNGVFAGAPVTYANSNVESYLPTYTGNLTPGNIIISSDNLKLSGGTANYVLSTDGTGNLSWVQQASGGTSSGGGESTVTSVDTFTGNGVDTVFTLSVSPQNINQTFINYNGAWQLRSAYTLSGQNVTFSEAPADGSVIEVTTQMNVMSGSGNLTVRTYTADGVQTDYTVSAGVNATNILVTENGLLQTPVADYTVTGTTLTFTTAPGNNVKVQIRELGVAVATITPVGSNTQVLFNDSGNFGHSANFTFNKTTNTLSVSNLSVTGNIIPTANVTYDLGSPTNRFKDLYLSGTTIDLGGATMTTDATTGTIALVAAPSVSNPNPTALVITSAGATIAANTTGGNVDFTAVANTLANTSGFSGSYDDLTNKPSKFMNMVQPGNITTPFIGVSRCYPTANIVITNVYASLGTPASDALSFELLKNNTSVGTYNFSSNSYRMTTTSANISVTTSDYLTLNVTAGTGATDLKVDFEYTLQ